MPIRRYQRLCFIVVASPVQPEEAPLLERALKVTVA
jgi:hypothetical protein